MALGFQTDIKPMFRESDRSAMLFAFDLWSYDDVALHATEILARIEDGSMPCDLAWSLEQSLKFREWIWRVSPMSTCVAIAAANGPAHR